MSRNDGVDSEAARPIRDTKDGSDAPDSSAESIPPIDIIVRFWLDAEPEVFSSLSHWLTAEVLGRASETQADLDAAKDDDTVEVDIESEEEE